MSQWIDVKRMEDKIKNAPVEKRLANLQKMFVRAMVLYPVLVSVSEAYVRVQVSFIAEIAQRNGLTAQVYATPNAWHPYWVSICYDGVKFASPADEAEVRELFPESQPPG